MEEQLLSYLDAIQAKTNEIELCNKAMIFLSELQTEFIVLNRKKVADLFCETLAVYQQILPQDVIGDVPKVIKQAFISIAQIAKEADTNENGHLLTIAFLNELYRSRGEHQTDTKIEQDEFKKLVEDIGKISFVFKIEDEEGKLFPVNHLIAAVISDQEFIKNKIKEYHICMLQLAVEIFKTTTDENLVKSLVEEHNLRFIDYMDGTHEIIDTKDMLNYKQNGVMIFHNSRLNSVLIRHEKKTYFTQDIVDKYNCTVEYETNGRNEQIGAFVEIAFDGDDELLDFSTVLKESPIEFLELLFDDGCRNVFIQNTIVKSNGKFHAINPFCRNDEKIVKGKLRALNGKSVNKNDIVSVINKYWMQSVCGKGINRVTLGLCIMLLEKRNCGVNVLGLRDEGVVGWFQNHVIKKWVESSIDPEKDTAFVMKRWLDEIAYCSRDLKEFKMCEENRKNFYPIALETPWVYQVYRMPSTPSVYRCRIFRDNEEMILEIISRGTIASSRNKNITTLTEKEIELGQETTREDYFVEEKEHYILQKEDGSWYGDNEYDDIFKLVANVERQCEKGLLSDSLCSLISSNDWKTIMNLMELHKSALMDVDHRTVFDDFESMAVYRFMHNLIFYNIDEGKWHSYYTIFNRHQALEFEEIQNDPYFQLSEEKTLYVPKDKEEQDAVLSSIYMVHLKTHYIRDKKSLYRRELSKNEDGKFCIDNQVIEKIVFLFDNIESGTSSNRTMALYLGKEQQWIEWRKERDSRKSEDNLVKELEKCRPSMHTYIVDGKEVMVSEIINTNNPAVYLHSYYGTDEAKELGREFLKICGIEVNEDTVSYENEITTKAEMIRTECKAVWPEQAPVFNGNQYLVVREFNMPKQNVFPKEMCGDAERVICLFVKKRE